MLVSIALTAATVCTARAGTKRLNETQWPETRDETRDASVRDPDRLETETSRPLTHSSGRISNFDCMECRLRNS